MAGQLRIYLGVAPGAGATFRMLEEAHRRQERGADVIVGFVDTHARPRTQEILAGLALVPTRGTNSRELDLDALLERGADLILVDDLAERHAEGAAHSTRFDEVRVLLDAGLDVLGTLDVAKLASVRAAILEITGEEPIETIPDELVQEAEQIELVDITPEALRRRLAHGNVVDADAIGASISNYFRASNLATLRLIAVTWFTRYLESTSRDPDDTPPDATPERIVVGVTGSGADEALLARCEVLVSRVGAEIVCVHVAGLGRHHDSVDLTRTRALAAARGAIVQEIADDDVAAALVAFATSQRATQLVIGASRARSGARLDGLTGAVLSQARGLDVHVVPVTAETPVHLQRRRSARIPWTRRLGALGATLVGLPLLTALLAALHITNALSVVIPVYLAIVIALSAWGGFLVGALSSVAASFLENFYFVAPRHSFEVARVEDLAALIAFLAFSIAASVAVAAFTRRSSEAERARTEAELLARAAATVATGPDDVRAVLDSLRVIFDLSRVELLIHDNETWALELSSGELVGDEGSLAEFTIDATHVLRVHGSRLSAHDRAMMSIFLGRVAAGLAAQRVEQEASSLRAVAEADALRTGLLRAVSHDLRTPLATIEANVSTLLARDVTWSENDQLIFLGAIEREVHRLTRLVTNLLDAGRLEAGVVRPRHVSVAVDDLVASALETIDTQGRHITIDIPASLPNVVTDPGLYERVVANVVANACRFSPPEESVTIRAGVDARYLDLLVIDRGPGVEAAMKERMLAPFQRLSDESSGAGLGLTVANGFITLLRGSLRMEDTPGGGLTAVIAIPVEENP